MHWRELTNSVHKRKTPIFAELSHSGSQSMMPGIKSLSPSIVPNMIYGNKPQECSENDILSLIDSFKKSAILAMEAGFDGIHIHGGNGYLISQFCSPLTNLRKDKWGGSPENRKLFIISVLEAIKSAVGKSTPVTARIGLKDVDVNGLSSEEGLDTVKILESKGLDGVELTYNIMNSYKDNIKPFAGVSLNKAIKTGLPLFGSFGNKNSEGYYLKFSKNRLHIINQLTLKKIISPSSFI